jgi:peroxiredoxin
LSTRTRSGRPREHSFAVTPRDAVMKKLPPVSRPASPLVRGESVQEFQLIDPVNKLTICSSELLCQGPLLLTFYRGAWCGCCETDLRDVAQSLPVLQSKNVNVLGVFHDLDPSANARIRDTYKLGFPLVDDPEGKVAEQFGIRRSASEMAEIEDEFGPELLALREGQPWIMPMQARFLLTRDGKVAHTEIVTDYDERSDVARLLSVVDGLR